MFSKTRTLGAPFSDITLYAPSSYSNDTPQYWDELHLQNFICDLYTQKMNGYKPPKTSRVCIQPSFYKVWEHPSKFGSIAHIAVEFLPDKFKSLDTSGKHRYILDIVHTAMTQLSAEYNWDHAVFENAYQTILDSNFYFSIDYPEKMSRDRKTSAHLRITKTENRSAIHVVIKTNDSEQIIKLFEKRNSYWYDCLYTLAKHSKWLNSNTFGFSFQKGKVEAWYSMATNQVTFFEFSKPVEKLDFSNSFWMQLPEED